MWKVAIGTGKGLVSALLFLIACYPAQFILLAIFWQDPPFPDPPFLILLGYWDDFAVPVTAFFFLSPLAWYLQYRTKSNAEDFDHWFKRLRWIIMPPFWGAVVSIPLLLFAWWVSPLGD